MKPFFQKHKIVMIALVAVLGFGILAGLALAGAIRLSMRDLRFATVADAHSATDAPTAPAESEQPDVPTIKLSAATIADIVANTEARREGVIPHRQSKSQADEGVWESEPVDNAQRERILKAANALTVTLFGQTIEALTGSNASATRVTCLRDTAGFRDTIAIVTDAEQLYRLTLREADCALLNADLLVFPEHAADAASTVQDAKRIADALGMRATVVNSSIGGSVQEGQEFNLCDETGTCLTVLYYGDRLTQVAVYPNAEAMYEDVYFPADVRYGNMDPAYPKNFVEQTEPLTSGENHLGQRLVRALRDLEYVLTGERNHRIYDYTVKLLRDESGAREDVFTAETDGLYCEMSAHSRNIMTLTCEIPCKELRDIPYDKMGGEAYVKVANDVAKELFMKLGGKMPEGDSFVNAIYDGRACTMDVQLTDGTVYELLFLDGVLSQITYYATEAFIIDAPGWVADNVYTNRVTGEQCIPSVSDWDGDLHIKKANNSGQ